MPVLQVKVNDLELVAMRARKVMLLINNATIGHKPIRAQLALLHKMGQCSSFSGKRPIMVFLG